MTANRADGVAWEKTPLDGPRANGATSEGLNLLKERELTSCGCCHVLPLSARICFVVKICQYCQ